MTFDEATDEGGTKHDANKLRFELIPPEAEEALAAVLGYGAQEYGDRNWEKGLEWSRVYAAARRHLNAFWRGEDSDWESGMSHLDHALCCVAFLVAYRRRGTGVDDRPKCPVAPTPPLPSDPYVWGDLAKPGDPCDSDGPHGTCKQCADNDGRIWKNRMEWDYSKYGTSAAEIS